jgi:hypothetical protein
MNTGKLPQGTEPMQETQNPAPEATAAEAKQNPSKEAKQKPAKEEVLEANPVDAAKYEQYANLKFLVLDGAQLKESAEKELKELEKEILSCSGEKAKKTVTASFGSRYIRLVKDVPVPQEISDFITAQDKKKHYFV